jgi:hypothetical protein
VLHEDQDEFYKLAVCRWLAHANSSDKPAHAGARDFPTHENASGTLTYENAYTCHASSYGHSVETNS